MMASTCGTKSSIVNSSVSTPTLRARSAPGRAMSVFSIGPASRSASCSRRTARGESRPAERDRLDELDAGLDGAPHRARGGDLLQPLELLLREIAVELDRDRERARRRPVVVV